MKKLFLCLAVCGLLATGCEKDESGNGSDVSEITGPDGNTPGDGGGSTENTSPTPLPELPDPADVCSCMDDSVFRQYCYNNFDTDRNGQISRAEAEAVTEIDLSKAPYNTVRSLKGIGYFSNLEMLNCSGCSELLSADLSNNLKMAEIGYRAFCNCSRLKSITIPNSVKLIGAWAFGFCSSLTNIMIPDSVTWILDYAFWACSSLTSVTIPDSVTTIGEGAFVGCKGLTSITIPDSVTSIGNFAFERCSGLTCVTIPDSVTSFGYGVFSGCSSLTSVTIPDSVTRIATLTFQLCSSLKSIYCKAQTPPSVGDYAFDNFTVTLYVPTGCKAAYAAADGWKYFTTIEEVEF